MKLFGLFVLLVCGLWIAGCASVSENLPLVGEVMYTPTMESYPTATPTLPDYQSAAAAATEAFQAKQTAESVNITIAQITADASSMQMEGARMTQSAEAMSANLTMVSVNATGTAYGTSVPLTATQQAAVSTQIADIFTATANAPTMAAAYLKLDHDKNFAPLEHTMKMVFIVAACIFLVSVPIFLFLNWRTNHSRQEEQPTKLEPEQHVSKPEIVEERHFTLEVEQASESHYKSGDIYYLPCSKDDFTNLVDAILSGWSWGYNQWQTRTAPVEFKTFRKMRQFALVNNWVMVVPNSDGRVMNTALGDRIFTAWQDGVSNNLEFTEGITL